MGPTGTGRFTCLPRYNPGNTLLDPVDRSDQKVPNGEGNRLTVKMVRRFVKKKKEKGRSPKGLKKRVKTSREGPQ